MDEKDKKEKYIKFLFELTELQEAFMGLQVYRLSVYCYRFFFQDNVYGFIPFLRNLESVFLSQMRIRHSISVLVLVHFAQMETASMINGTRYYVMAVTPTRLYSFTGSKLNNINFHIFVFFFPLCFDI